MVQQRRGRNCWEKYLADAHHAMPIGPLETNLQLLDILLDGGSSEAAACCSCCVRLLHRLLCSFCSYPSICSEHRHEQMIPGAGANIKLVMDGQPTKITSLLSLCPEIRSKYQSLFELNHEHIDFGSKRYQKPMISSAPLPAKDRGLAGTGGGADDIGPINVQITSTAAAASDVITIANPAPAAASDIVTIADDPAAQLPNKYFIKQSLPDIVTVISTSESRSASLAGRSLMSPVVSAHFDVRGAEQLNIKVSGVKSDRIDHDELMIAIKDVELLQQRQLEVAKMPEGRGRNCTSKLWIVTEVLYAERIEFEAQRSGKATAGVSAATATAPPITTAVSTRVVSSNNNNNNDNNDSATAAAATTTTTTTAAALMTEIAAEMAAAVGNVARLAAAGDAGGSRERDVRWVVTSPNSSAGDHRYSIPFPFAFKALRLHFDDSGKLIPTNNLIKLSKRSSAASSTAH